MIQLRDLKARLTGPEAEQGAGSCQDSHFDGDNGHRNGEDKHQSSPVKRAAEGLGAREKSGEVPVIHFDLPVEN